VKAEEYEAAVNTFLKALDLDPANVITVNVEPHQATAKVRVARSEEAKYDYSYVVIKRDDAVAIKVDVVDIKNIKTTNARQVAGLALKLSGKADEAALTEAEKAIALYTLAIKGQGPKGYLI
jgi:tetratricopeptide (TPR) repeat protein